MSVRFRTRPDACRPAGFTLVELLVVIGIVVLLAGLALTMVNRSMARARSANAMSNLRQCGMILLSDASEKGDRLNFFSGGASGGFDLRPYNMVRAFLGKPQGEWNNLLQNRIDVMHWDPKRVPPKNFHWNCYAVNFTQMLDWGVEWKIENGRADGSNGRVLQLSKVIRPESYPILMDGSTSDGSEIFRVGIVANEMPGLRNQGKAHAFMLDGSGSSLDRKGLRDAGFNRAYDNSTDPPRSITL